MRGGLELGELAVVPHRAGIVEHQRELELLHAPLHLRLEEMSSFCWPSRRVNVVGTVPLAVTSRMKLPCCGLDSTPLACTLVTSERLNCALKNESPWRPLRRIHAGGVARQHQRGGVERSLHRGTRRVAAAVVDRRADQTDDRDDRERKHRCNAAALVGDKS